MPDARAPQTTERATAVLLLVCIALCLLPGCSRRFWRKQADDDTYRAVSEKLTDARWQIPRMDMTPDARSRFYDPYDPDCEPLPPDDPAAHHFMHCVSGREGSKRWHEFGDAFSMENPSWLEPYQVLLQTGDPVEGHAMVSIPTVTLQESIDLTYIHSREYQTAIEDVYLDALALTLERYRLGTQFQVPGSGSGVGGGLLAAGLPRNGQENASLQNGLGIQQLLPGGTNLAVNVLNTITWNTSSGSGTATRLAWEVTQPFLNGAGRKLILEALTQAERSLLYEVRTLARFRQTLFTGIATDYLNILRQIQNIKNLENNIRQLEEQIEIGKARDNRIPRQVAEPLLQKPEGFEIPESLRPFFSWDERLQLLRWRGPLNDDQKEQILGLSDDGDYQAAVQQLIRWKEMQVVSLSVAQLVTRLNGQQNRLQDARRQLADLLDSFKISLGLPTNIRMTVDEVLLMPFELIDPNIVEIENNLKDLARNQGPGLIPAPDGAEADEKFAPDFDRLKKYISDLRTFRNDVQKNGLETVRKDFVPVRDLLKETGDRLTGSSKGMRYFSSDEERSRVIADVARDSRLFRINERDFERVSNLIEYLYGLVNAKSDQTLISSLDKDGNGQISQGELPIGWSELPRAPRIPEGESIEPKVVLTAIRDAAMGLREDLTQIAQSLQVVQAGLRVETISLNRFVLPGTDEVPDIEEVVRIGLQNRHDLMNARAAVMDARRQVEVTANALMSVMNLRASGTVDPDGGTNDGVDLSLEFKAPLDQVEERNAYRRAQVNYQRERRTYMQLEDQVKQQIRSSWRQLMVSEQQLEIDRQTVRNAALQYDNAALLATGAGQENSFNLLNALDSVLQAQNSLVSDWITYETNRLNIFRDMGIMEIDSTGIWEDEFYQVDGVSPENGAENDFSEDPPAPTVLTPQLQSE